MLKRESLARKCEKESLFFCHTLTSFLISIAMSLQTMQDGYGSLNKTEASRHARAIDIFSSVEVEETLLTGRDEKIRPLTFTGMSHNFSNLHIL